MEDESVPLFRDFAEEQFEFCCATGGRMAEGLTEKGEADLRWKFNGGGVRVSRRESGARDGGTWRSRWPALVRRARVAS